jgi:amino acid permease
VVRPVTSRDSATSCIADSGAIITTPNASRPSFWTRLGVTPESFRRRTANDEHNQLNQTLKSRHLSMIAIGGSIGAGLFVGSGKALSTGGPAALLIGFGLIGVVSLCIRCNTPMSQTLISTTCADDVQCRLCTRRAFRIVSHLRRLLHVLCSVHRPK